MMKRLMVLAAAAVMGATAACESSVTGPRALSLTITPSATTAAVGDSLTFTANAEGTALVDLEADYGDGANETVTVSASQTVSVRFRHAYSAPGTYTVTVTASDEVKGHTTATVAIHIS